MNCKECGFQLPENSKYCLNCGIAQTTGSETTQTRYVISYLVRHLYSESEHQICSVEVQGTDEGYVRELYEYIKLQTSLENIVGLSCASLKHHKGLSSVECKDGEFIFSYRPTGGRDYFIAQVSRRLLERLVDDGWLLQPLSGEEFKPIYTFYKVY